MDILSKLEEAWSIRRSKMEDALVILDALLDTLNEDEDTFYHTITILGMIRIYQNDYLDAENLLTKAYEYYKRQMNTCYFSRAANSLGVLYITQGLFSDAMLCLREGLEVSKKAGEDEMTIFMLYNVAEIYKAIHSYDKALQPTEEAIELNKSQGHALTAALLSSCAFINLKAKQYVVANAYADLSIKTADHNDQYTFGLCYTVLADIMIHHENYEKAKEYCQMSLKARIAIDDQFAIANNYLQLGIISYHEEDFEACIKYCQKANEISSLIEGRALDDDVYKYLAKSYSKLRMFNKASMYCEKLTAEQDRIFNQRLNQTVSIMTAEQKYESLKRQAEHYQSTSEALKKENKTIQTITKIGQSIVNALDVEMLIGNIRNSLNTLMDAKHIAIGFLDDEGYLNYEIILRDGIALPKVKVLKNQKSYGMIAIDNHETIYLNDLQQDDDYVQIDDSEKEDSKSCLFCPLFIELEPVGVLSIQSDQVNAYSQEQIMLLEGIASFIAIAMDNVRKTSELKRTVDQLEETKDALVKAETLAGLGQLVSGVAHELNTPIGSALTMNSYLIKKNEDFSRLIKGNALSAKMLEDRLEDNHKVLNSTQEAIQQASEMVQSFKTLATDKNRLKHQAISTAELLERVKLENSLMLEGRDIVINSYGESLIISTYPTILYEVFKQLIMNSLHHSKASEINIESTHDENYTCFIYSDNGIPIPDDVIPKIFQPFFGTRKKDGFMGLGLHAVHNMITQVLHGSIEYKPHSYKILIKR